MNEIYTTPQLAELLGCNSGYIRKLKHDHPDKLIENEHWRKEGNETFWTSQALTVLASMIKTEKALAISNGSGVEKSYQFVGDQHIGVGTGNPIKRFMESAAPTGQALAQRLGSAYIRQMDEAFFDTIFAMADETPISVKGNVDRQFAILEQLSTTQMDEEENPE